MTAANSLTLAFVQMHSSGMFRLNNFTSCGWRTADSVSASVYCVDEAASMQQQSTIGVPGWFDARCRGPIHRFGAEFWRRDIRGHVFRRAW